VQNCPADISTCQCTIMLDVSPSFCRLTTTLLITQASLLADHNRCSTISCILAWKMWQSSKQQAK
jgi:hypothetical protein